MPIRGLEPLDGKLLDGLSFCAVAYDILDGIQAEPGGLEEIRLLRTSRAKKMVEEILPIAAYVQARYGPGLELRVRWRGGSQQHDARLLCSGVKAEYLRMPAVQHLEITTAVHPNEYLVREHLHREGFSFSPHGTRRDAITKHTVSTPTVRSGDEAQRELADRVRSGILAKAAKAYPPNTSLIVRCVVNAPVLDDEWDQVVRLLRNDDCPKRFREVVLMEPISGRVTSLFVRRLKTARGRRRCSLGDESL